MSVILHKVLDAEAIDARVRELAREISEHYADEPVVLICVLKGAYLFFADLMRHLTIEPTIDFLRLSTYQEGCTPSGCLTFKDMETPIADRHVLLVEDIVDTGRSLAFLKEILGKRGPRSLKVCALVDKRERREVDIEVDFAGFALSKGFLVGYGMDHAERYRGLDAVYELVQG